MARMSYKEVLNNNNQRNGEAQYKVGFFSLKDGEEAIVRFNISTPEDIETLTVHPITVQPSRFPNNRKVSCLRESANDPMDLCPLCAKGENVQQRVYMPILQYVTDNNNNITTKAVIWDRPAFQYVPQLVEYLRNYGDLRNVICKIVRHGSGMNDTKYDIIPNLNPQIYNENTYVKDFSDFENFTVLSGMVLNKSTHEIEQFIQTGQFPTENENTENNVEETYTTSNNSTPSWDNESAFENSPQQRPVMRKPRRY